MRFKYAAWTSCLLLLLAQPGYPDVVRLPNGDVYDGDLQEGLRHGEGIYRWENGNTYEGDFQQNTMHGQGTFTWADGRVYTGEFVEDRREGQGTLVWENGDTYSGSFERDRIHGAVHLSSDLQEIRQEGQDDRQRAGAHEGGTTGRGL